MICHPDDIMHPKKSSLFLSSELTACVQNWLPCFTVSFSFFLFVSFFSPYFSISKFTTETDCTSKISSTAKARKALTLRTWR